jgi:hypothetical protein
VIDVFLSRSKPLSEALRQFGCQISHLPEDGVQVINTVTKELSIHITILLIINLRNNAFRK